MYMKNDTVYIFSCITSLLFEKIRSIVIQIEFSLEPYYRSQPKQQKYWLILALSP